MHTAITSTDILTSIGGGASAIVCSRMASLLASIFCVCPFMSCNVGDMGGAIALGDMGGDRVGGSW